MSLCSELVAVRLVILCSIVYEALRILSPSEHLFYCGMRERNNKSSAKGINIDINYLEKEQLISSKNINTIFNVITIIRKMQIILQSHS